MKHNFAAYPNEYFVETGSGGGHGIRAAIQAGFPNIRSIELSPRYYKICRRQFKKHKNVTLYCGDSSEILGDVIKDIDVSITFWLDSHFSGADTAMGKEAVPLMPELQIIKAHPVKTHILLLDDMRLLRKKTEPWTYLEYSEQDLKHFILGMNPDYKLHYESTKYDPKDVLVATV
jgi:hypothetical protein